MTIPRKQWRLNLGSSLVFVINSFIVLTYSNHYEVLSKLKDRHWIYVGKVLKNVHNIWEHSLLRLIFCLLIFSFAILSSLAIFNASYHNTCLSSAADDWSFDLCLQCSTVKWGLYSRFEIYYLLVLVPKIILIFISSPKIALN